MSPDGKFYWDGTRWVPTAAGAAVQVPAGYVVKKQSHTGRNVAIGCGALIAIIITLSIIGSLLGGNTSGGSNSSGQNQSAAGAVLEVDLDGQPIAYLSSDNVDATSLGSPDTSSHVIASLPSGLVQVCHYTLSQGVNWTVWAIAGSSDSLDFAHSYCQRNGQS
jgi:hypothetical protein